MARINLDEDLEFVDISKTQEDTLVRTKKKKKKKKQSIMKEIMLNSLYLLAVLVLTLLFVKYVAQRTTVIGASMETTLSEGDNLIVDKISYKFTNPKRFDIIVFPFEYEKDTFYIKRVIGLPNETVRIDTSGNIYINGEILSENYGAEVIRDPGLAINEIKLGDDEYFVLGDNRNHSSDSRTQAVGIISREKIVGKAWLQIYPFNEIGFIGHS